MVSLREPANAPCLSLRHLQGPCFRATGKETMAKQERRNGSSPRSDRRTRLTPPMFGTKSDTNLNAVAPNYAVQSIALSGMALEVPILSFAAIPAQAYGNAPFTVSATSASSGAVTYAVVSGPATITGSTVTLTGVGTVVLSASQIAAGNYAAGLCRSRPGFDGFACRRRGLRDYPGPFYPRRHRPLQQAD